MLRGRAVKRITKLVIFLIITLILGFIPETKAYALRTAWNEPGVMCGVPYHYEGDDRVFEGPCPFTLNTPVEDDGDCIFFYTTIAQPNYLDYNVVWNNAPGIKATLEGRGATSINYWNLQTLGKFPGINGYVVYMCAYKDGITVPMYKVDVPNAPVELNAPVVDYGAYMEVYEIRNPFRFDNWDYYLQSARAWEYMRSEANKRWGNKGCGGEILDYAAGDIEKDGILYRKIAYYNPECFPPQQLEGCPVQLWTPVETANSVYSYIMNHDGNYILNVYSDITIQATREIAVNKWPEGGWYGHQHTEHIKWNGMTICKIEYKKYNK